MLSNVKPKYKNNLKYSDASRSPRIVIFIVISPKSRAAGCGGQIFRATEFYQELEVK